MRNISHGSTSGPRVKTPEEVLKELQDLGLADRYDFEIADNPAPTFPIGRMFRDMAADKDSLVPESENPEEILKTLAALGNAMHDIADLPKFDSTIPSAYTYFSQLVNHDISFTDVVKPDGVTDAMVLADPQLRPWSDDMIKERVSNKRARVLELDCVYGSMQGGVLPPFEKGNHSKMALGKVTPAHDPPADADFNDLVRCPRTEDRKKDRTALIADRRNDSNIMLSQLQVAFLRAHNAVVDKKQCSFAEAQGMLQQHYQWMVLNEFLPLVVPAATLKEVEEKSIYKPEMGVPLEFSMAAFRFGHAMIRRNYYLNKDFNPESLKRLFTMIVLCNQANFEPMANAGSDTLPKEYIINWTNFLEGGRNKARAIRTEMVDPLFGLFDDTDVKMEGLAAQDLKRAYMMRIPTGQAIARELNVQDPLTAADMKQVLPPEQFTILESSGLLERTPLPFYVLAEAKKQADKLEPPENPDKGKLGPVGGRIVAEVIIGLIRNNPHSYLNDKTWEKPHLPAEHEGKFFLSDLLTLAGVLQTP